MSETPLIDVAIAAIEARGWSYQRDGDASAIAYPVRGERAMYEGVVATTEEARFLTFYCAFASRVPDARRPAMLEAIARANYGLQTGAFEMGLDDGVLRFRDGAIVKGSEFLPRMLRDMIAFCGFVCDRYYEALMAVAFDGKEPAGAIEEVDGM